MKQITIIISLFLLMLLNVFAVSEFPDYIKGQNITLSVSCRLLQDQSNCPAGTLCNMTLKYPNSSYYVANEPMTLSGTMANYNLPNSNVTGKYQGHVNCVSGSLYGNDDFTMNIINSCPNTASDLTIYGFIILLALGLLFLGLKFKLWYSILFSAVIIMVIASMIYGCQELIAQCLYVVGFVIFLVSVTYIKMR
jgi:hypothetical protein